MYKRGLGDAQNVSDESGIGYLPRVSLDKKALRN